LKGQTDLAEFKNPIFTADSSQVTEFLQSSSVNFDANTEKISLA